MSCQEGNLYIVKVDDNLYNIATEKLGNGNRWREITKLDGSSFTDEDVTKLQPCQEICIPNRSANFPGGNGFTNIISAEIYEAMFPHRHTLYSYHSLVKATEPYSLFCSQGSEDQRLQEAAAFLAHIAHETTGGWDEAPGGRFAWGLHFIEEQRPTARYCDLSNTQYPCVGDQSYHGRGPIQLSWNYNYGQAGRDLGEDLLQNPDLVVANGVIAFKTALWFWMTLQQPKPSCHEVMTGNWTPSSEDKSKGRVPGFGLTINIINGGLECGEAHQNSDEVADRVGFYKHFAENLGVKMGENLFCNQMASY